MHSVVVHMWKFLVRSSVAVVETILQIAFINDHFLLLPLLVSGSVMVCVHVT